jgi:hypothetical protein
MAKAILPAGWREEDGFCAWFNSTLSITVWRERYGRYWGILENGKEVGPFKNLTQAISAVEAQCKPGILFVSTPLKATDVICKNEEA